MSPDDLKKNSGNKDNTKIDFYVEPEGIAKSLAEYDTYSTLRIIPGTKGVVTGGDSIKLGKNIMGQKRSKKWTGYQAQHIIPAEMVKHQVLQKIGCF